MHRLIAPAGLLAVATLIAASLLPALPGQAQSPGIVGQPAPAWTVDGWSNLPAGRDTLDVSDFKGKVVYLFCFQSWCPGCHSHGFPTLQAVREHYAGQPEVAFVAVQTVFEGFSSNTRDHGARTLEDFQLPIPWAQAEGRRDAAPAFMRAYRTGGTPWTIIIDPRGVVRFNGFQIRPEEAIAVIDPLLPANG